MLISDQIKQARVEAKYSQTDAGKLVNVSRWTIIKWELGRAEPHPAILRELLCALKHTGNKVSSCEPIPEQIKQARVAAKYNQADAGELVGVSRWTFIKWELGRAKPHPAILRELLSALGRATGKPRPRKPRKPRQSKAQPKTTSLKAVNEKTL